MRYNKTDFQIIVHDINEFSINIRKPFLKFFHRWIPIKYQEAEHTEEKLLVFDKLEDATKFIENIVE